MNERLEKIIKQVFELPAEGIDPGWTSDEIPDWDSVGHLNLMMEIEKEFGIKIEIEEMFEIEKLGDIAVILEKKNVEL